MAISVVITSFFYIRVQKQTAASRPRTRKIVVTNAALQPGTKLSASNLGTIDWPEAVPLQGSFSKAEDVTDKIVYVSIGANEPILERELASSNSSLGLAGKIPDGMRATAVRTNEVSNLAGFLFPGSRVDVLVTFRNGENNRPVTRTVLQNVQVLSTGQNIQANPEGKPENVNVVTLMLTPEDSQKLVLAQAEGTIQFVLRNGNDSAKPLVPPVQVAELTGEMAKPANPTQPLRRTERRKPAVFTVETVAGNKSSVTTFPENN